MRTAIPPCRCVCAADAPPRTCGPDYHLGGGFGAEPSCAVYTAGSNIASILSKPLKRSSGDQADDPWKGLNKQLLALRTPPTFFFFFVHLCEHLAEMMTRCRGTQGELLLCCVGCVFVVSYACIRQSLKEVLAVPVN